MYRPVRYSLCTLLILLPLSLAGAIPIEKWQKFSSPVAGFSVLMPGEVRESVGPPRVDNAYGSLRSYSAEVGLDEGLFAAAEHIFAQDFDTQARVSQYISTVFRRRQRGTSEGKLLAKQMFRSEEYPPAGYPLPRRFRASTRSRKSSSSKAIASFS